MNHENDHLLKEVAEVLGITRDGVLKLAKRLGIGVKEVGLWWFTEDELVLMKNNCRKFLMAARSA